MTCNEAKESVDASACMIQTSVIGMFEQIENILICIAKNQTYSSYIFTLNIFKDKTSIICVAVPQVNHPRLGNALITLMKMAQNIISVIALVMSVTLPNRRQNYQIWRQT